MEFKTIVTGTIILFLALVAGPYLAVQLDYLASPLPLGVFRYFGVVMMFFGAPLAVWCSYLLLVPGKDKAIPTISSDRVVITGPYKYVRNPFILGWIFILYGEVVFARSVPLLVYALVLSLCVHFWVVGFEEPSLEDKYGEEYRRYKKSVPRWIPRIKS